MVSMRRAITLFPRALRCAARPFADQPTPASPFQAAAAAVDEALNRARSPTLQPNGRPSSQASGTPSSPHSGTDSLLAHALQGRVVRAAQRKDYMTVLKEWREARATGNKELISVHCYVAILATCVDCASPNPSRKMNAADAKELFGTALKVFSSLVESNQTPSPEAFNLVAKVHKSL